MRIAINGFALGTRGGGIETYVLGLVSALPVVDPGSEYMLLLRPSVPDDLPISTRLRRVVIQPPTRYVPASIPTALALVREGIDVVHQQFAAPLLCPSR